MINKYNNQTSQANYFENKENFKNLLHKVFMFIKENPGQTREEILKNLKLKSGNGARLTDLQDADYIAGKVDHSLSTPANRYYALVQDFKTEDFTAEKIEERRFLKVGSNKRMELEAKIGRTILDVLADEKLNSGDRLRFVLNLQRLHAEFLEDKSEHKFFIKLNILKNSFLNPKIEDDLND